MCFASISICLCLCVSLSLRIFASARVYCVAYKLKDIHRRETYSFYTVRVHARVPVRARARLCAHMPTRVRVCVYLGMIT